MIYRLSVNIRSHSRLALIDHPCYGTKFAILFNISSELAELFLKSYHKKFEHTVSFETAK